MVREMKISGLTMDPNTNTPIVVLKDPNSEISKQLEKHGGKQIRADLGLNTGIRYQGI